MHDRNTTNSQKQAKISKFQPRVNTFPLGFRHLQNMLTLHALLPAAR